MQEIFGRHREMRVRVVESGHDDALQLDDLGTRVSVLQQREAARVDDPLTECRERFRFDAAVLRNDPARSENAKPARGQLANAFSKSPSAPSSASKPRSSSDLSIVSGGAIAAKL